LADETLGAGWGLAMNILLLFRSSEAGSATLSQDTPTAANAAFQDHGCVVLRGAFAPALIDEMHREFVAQFGRLDVEAMQTETSKPRPNRFLKVGLALRHHTADDWRLRQNRGVRKRRVAGVLASAARRRHAAQ
jgi:hypothetical protein